MRTFSSTFFKGLMKWPGVYVVCRRSHFGQTHCPPQVT
uniref:Uncharacterized protein n=1 Tax=Anguilla anguilla TaxID=7936 RepID=A0A0E9XYI6_ANGAN